MLNCSLEVLTAIVASDLADGGIWRGFFFSVLLTELAKSPLERILCRQTFTAQRCCAWVPLNVVPPLLSLCVGDKTSKDSQRGVFYSRFEHGSVPVVQDHACSQPLCCSLLSRTITLRIWKQALTIGELGARAEEQGTAVQPPLSLSLAPAHGSGKQMVPAGPAAQRRRAAMHRHLPRCLRKHHTPTPINQHRPGAWKHLLPIAFYYYL